MEAVAEHELSVVLSSHLVSDLERVCDYLIVLVASRVQLAGDVDTLLATHHRLTGARRDPDTLPADQHVIAASHTDRQTTVLVRTDGPDPRPRLDRRPARPGRPGPRLHARGAADRDSRPAPGGAPMIWLTWRQFRTQAAVVGRRARRPRRHPGRHRPGPGRRLRHRDRRLHHPGGDCSDFVDRFFQRPPEPVPRRHRRSCWSCPP